MANLHLVMDILNAYSWKKIFVFYSHLTVFSEGSNLQKVSRDSCDGLTPKRWQAIIVTEGCHINCSMYRIRMLDTPLHVCVTWLHNLTTLNFTIHPMTFENEMRRTWNPNMHPDTNILKTVTDDDDIFRNQYEILKYQCQIYREVSVISI